MNDPVIVKALKIQNIGIIEDAEIQFDKPLLVFYGEIGAGKSTIIKAIGWLFGGAFPSDIIRHGQKEAVIEMTLADGLIRREFYRGKSGEQEVTKAREVLFVRNGRPVQRPVSEIKRLVNPFLGDQDYLVRMGEADRNAYFAQMFAVDTKALDTEFFNLDQEAKKLRARIAGYGEIDLTPVPASNAAELRAKISEARKDYNTAVSQHGQKQVDANGRAADRKRWTDELGDLNREMEELNRSLENKRKRFSQVEKFLLDFPPIDAGATPVEPDTSVLDEQLAEAVRNEERAKTLEANKERAAKKTADEKGLKAIEERLRAIKGERKSKLNEVTDKCGVPGLAFDEQGVLFYEGTQAGMLSTSQLMRLSSQLSALYPKGISLELIDRAESLGKSIFNFVEKAKREEKTILATIVGEAPATAPDEVGVFVVEKGKVSKKGVRKESDQTPKEGGLL